VNPAASGQPAPGPALLLIGHGSRDPEAATELDQLVGMVTELRPGRATGAGYLELADPHVDVAIDSLVADGANDIVAVPYVLFGAGHLKDDGPAVLARARRRHPTVRFRLARDLGIHPAVLSVAEDRARCALGTPEGSDPERSAVVLVGRGSTDPDACADFVKFARLLEDGRGLGAVEPAFVAMSRPNVEEAMDRCRRLGVERIAVVPLFLFRGVLVDRIAERAANWAADRHDVGVSVGHHLGADRRLAELVIERHREAVEGDVRMNCDLCVYRVRLPGFEEKVGTPLSLAPAERAPRGWRARRAANQDADRAAERRSRPRRGLGRRTGLPPAPEGDGPAVRVAALHHRWPDGTEALAGVELVVERRERVAVLGPNGSGKTTLALHLIGALERQTGEVTVTGLDVTSRNLSEVRRRVGIVFQDPDDQLLLPTVADDVAFGPRNQGLDDATVAERVAAALDVVGLTDLAARPPHHLSLGERRRAALAGVLAMHPEVLLLDEPSANLDPAARRDLVEIVGGLAVTTLVITHDLSLALELCPRSVVLDRGRVAADGPTDALLSNPALMAAHRLDLPYGMVVHPPTARARGGEPGDGRPAGHCVDGRDDARGRIVR